jgi:hypothetical protein
MIPLPLFVNWLSSFDTASSLLFQRKKLGLDANRMRINFDCMNDRPGALPVRPGERIGNEGPNIYCDGVDRISDAFHGADFVYRAK